MNQGSRALSFVRAFFRQSNRNRGWASTIAAAALSCLLLANGAIAADAFRESDREHAYKMLEGVQRTIGEKYYDPAIKGFDLGANAEVAKGRIAKASSIGETLSAIAQFALDLDDSHTFFVPPRQTTTVDYGWTMGMVGSACHVLRVKPDSDAAHQGVKRGDLVKTVNGLAPTRGGLWRIEYLFHVLRPQPGLHVELVSSTGVARELDLAAQVKQRKKVIALVGAGSGGNITELIEENEKSAREIAPEYVEVGETAPGKSGTAKSVLVVRMPSFMVEQRIADEIVSHMHGHESVIIDLRGNHGGRVDTMQSLIGGLSATDVAIGTLKERERTSPVVAKGSGNHAFTGRVFVLVDGQSASASEITARVLQIRERGTVIGDRTAGAVMTSRFHEAVVSHGENVIAYGTSVAIADLVMSDGKRLEKTGVNPDFVVLPTADDMASGRDPALAQALKFAGQTLDAAAAGALLHAN